MRGLSATVVAALIMLAGACAQGSDASPSGPPSAPGQTTSGPTPPPLVTTPVPGLGGPIEFHGVRVVAANAGSSDPGLSTLVYDPVTGGWIRVPGLAVPSPSGVLVAIKQDSISRDSPHGVFHRLGVLDLRTGDVTWTDIRPGNTQTPPVWSPEGDHIAIVEFTDAQMAPPPSSTVPTGPEASSSSITIIDVSVGGGVPALTSRVVPVTVPDVACDRSCGWRDNDTLIAAHWDNSSGTEVADGVVFLSARTGEKVGELNLPGAYTDSSDVAPGGRHMIINDNSFYPTLYDSVNGSITGLALALSTDGVRWVGPTQFVGVADGSLTLFDLAGQPIDALPLPGALRDQRGVSLGAT